MKANFRQWLKGKFFHSKGAITILQSAENSWIIFPAGKKGSPMTVEHHSQTDPETSEKMEDSVETGRKCCQVFLHSSI